MHNKKWPAPAKLNLFLHITGQREDGYHLLQTVFQILDFGDELQYQVRDDGVIRRVTEIEGVPAEQDLVVRVAERYFQLLAARDNLDFETANKDAIAVTLEQANHRV